MAKETSAPRSKVSKEQARASLPDNKRKSFDELVDSVGKWSIYFYGTKFLSYAILSELVRDGWERTGEKD
jgi:hypothetical protein